MTSGVSSLVLVIIVLATVGTFYFYQNQIPDDNASQETQNFPQSTKPASKGCTGEGTISFTHPPRKLEDIELIQPIGMISANGGHVTPTDHGYYYPPGWKWPDDPKDYKDVFSPAKGVVTNIQLVGGKQGDFRMTIHHTCTFYTVYIHIRELAPKIAQEAGEFNTMNKNLNIPVEAGELIGRANSFDFSVHNDDLILSGFIYPEHYNGEPWKIHTDDMFSYFVEPVKSQLLAKNMRIAEPYGGRIDYDIDGRLIGNWFKEGTGWYSGPGQEKASYWSGHLAIVPDTLDPSHFIFSIGDFGGVSKQFGIKNNPDPTLVSKSSGIVKYELVMYDFYDSNGKPWDRVKLLRGPTAKNDDNVQGTVLLQMIEDRKLKLETFPGKTASEVAGFVNPIIYER